MPPGAAGKPASTSSELPGDRPSDDQVLLYLARRAKDAYVLGRPLQVTPAEHTLLGRTTAAAWESAVATAFRGSEMEDERTALALSRHGDIRVAGTLLPVLVHDCTCHRASAGRTRRMESVSKVIPLWQSDPSGFLCSIV